MSSDDAVRSIPLLPEDSPNLPDPVMGPTLVYGEGLTLDYAARDGQASVRVTFEGLDSVRASRGEAHPYWSEENPGFAPISVVRPSAWLRERHAYEAKHYGRGYEWGRGADTMLVDTHHYLFLFHDEFVEVLARGVWFVRSPGPVEHDPFGALYPSTRVEAGEHDGIPFEVQAAGRPEAEILADARLCSQPLFHLLIDGETSPALEVRVRAGIDDDLIRAQATGSFGTHAGAWDHVPTADAALVAFRAWMSEVAERRREMRRRRSR